MYFSFTDNTSKMLVIFSISVIAALFVINLLYSIKAAQKTSEQKTIITNLQDSNRRQYNDYESVNAQNQNLKQSLQNVSAELTSERSKASSSSGGPQSQLDTSNTQELTIPNISNITDRSTANITQIKSGMRNLQSVLNSLAVARDELVHAIINDADEAIKHWQDQVDLARKQINNILNTLVSAVSAQEHTIAGLNIIAKQQKALHTTATGYFTGKGVEAQPTATWYTNRLQGAYGWDPANANDMKTGKSKRQLTPLRSLAVGEGVNNLEYDYVGSEGLKTDNALYTQTADPNYNFNSAGFRSRLIGDQLYLKSDPAFDTFMGTAT